MSEEDGSFWAGTIGNTFLSILDKRPSEADDWHGFKASMLPTGLPGEPMAFFKSIDEWNASAIEAMGSRLARDAGDIWY